MTLFVRDREREPEIAVVAANRGDGCVLWHAGGGLDYMLAEVSARLSEIGLDDAPDGVSIWEGHLLSWESHTPSGTEYDGELQGTFREPTPEEWVGIMRGDGPWPLYGPVEPDPDEVTP